MCQSLWAGWQYLYSCCCSQFIHLFTSIFLHTILVNIFLLNIFLSWIHTINFIFFYLIAIKLLMNWVRVLFRSLPMQLSVFWCFFSAAASLVVKPFPHFVHMKGYSCPCLSTLCCLTSLIVKNKSLHNSHSLVGLVSNWSINIGWYFSVCTFRARLLKKSLPQALQWNSKILLCRFRCSSKLLLLFQLLPQI